MADKEPQGDEIQDDPAATDAEPQGDDAEPKAPTELEVVKEKLAESEKAREAAEKKSQELFEQITDPDFLRQRTQGDEDEGPEEVNLPEPEALDEMSRNQFATKVVVPMARSEATRAAARGMHQVLELVLQNNPDGPVTKAMPEMMKLASKHPNASPAQLFEMVQAKTNRQEAEKALAEAKKLEGAATASAKTSSHKAGYGAKPTGGAPKKVKLSPKEHFNRVWKEEGMDELLEEEVVEPKE